MSFSYLEFFIIVVLCGIAYWVGTLKGEKDV